MMRTARRRRCSRSRSTDLRAPGRSRRGARARRSSPGRGRRGAILLREAVLVTAAVEPARDFYEHLAGAPEPARRAAVEGAGRALRRLHDARIFHRDYHAGNLLVREPAPGKDPEVVLLDLH